MPYVVLVALVVFLVFAGQARQDALLHVACYVKASPTLDFSHARQSSNNLIILPRRLLALFRAMFVHRPLAADSLPPPKE